MHGMAVKSKSGLHGICRRALLVVSLLVMLLFSSCFVYVFSSSVSPFVSGSSNRVVSSESELRAAVNDSAGPIVIAFNGDIQLSGELKIPADKDVTLTSNNDDNTGFFKLVGANGESTIFVDGTLRLAGIIITHANGDSGSGVTVNSDGTFIMSGGEISGNSAFRGDGGGVFNDGIFEMSGGMISYNTANVFGGGVFNRRTFEMSGGYITNNEATLGGGLYVQLGTFSMSGGEISYNKANRDGGGIHNQESNVNLFGGVISHNTAEGKGGGLCVSYFMDLEKVFVSDGVVFENNSADIAYNRDSAHDDLYNSHIDSNVVWTSPFKQGYNNYDISYTYGTPYDNTNGSYTLFIAAIGVAVVCIILGLAVYLKKKANK